MKQEIGANDTLFRKFGQDRSTMSRGGGTQFETAERVDQLLIHRLAKLVRVRRGQNEGHQMKGVEQS